ncbi:DNA (cytosine-5)-methyltransferase 1B-like [Canna indica]|uniref:DNA (Cytosine-5)-methyltransferase 1B-like n=1 Tax=Canna indica TaxID=4628 RepID=A0AAQ3JXG0_9LILI|nr:DNA (cytosine-5)-methyltransferase 1B-like [Canna indica]
MCSLIEGICQVRKKIDLPNLELPVVFDHVFFCEYSYDPIKGALKQLPAHVKVTSLIGKADLAASRKNKGKGKCDDILQDSSGKWNDVPRENRLATLDIFAGCGSLSEGLQQSGKSCIQGWNPGGFKIANQCFLSLASYLFWLLSFLSIYFLN